jgi:tRNA pseudouridine55 synthase
MQAILNIDKPAGMSSAYAVGWVKRLLPRKTKIGHAGTLDPFATGVLLLLVGRATKLCEAMMDQPKQYEAVVKLGSTTATDDPESPERPWKPTETAGVHPRLNSALVVPGIEEIRSSLPRFIGAISQQPPIFSALKVGGRRAYDLARKGHDVTLVPRMVNVYNIALLDYDWPLLRLRIDCGRGTYIRSIARDLGADLNVGGHLVQLRRTRVGQYTADAATKLDGLTAEMLAAKIIEWQSGNLPSEGVIQTLPQL